MTLALKTLRLEKRLTRYNFTDRNSLNRVEWLVIHYFGATGNALSAATWFGNPLAQSSAHLCLDEGKTVYQCVEFENIAWHCGDGGRGALKGVCTNSNSIGVEVRPKIMNPAQAGSAAYAGWYFANTTIENLVEVVAALMKAFNIPAERVVRHYDVTAKWCPRPYMGGDKNLYYQMAGDLQWKLFKARLEEDDMTGKEVYDKLNEYTATLPLPDWAKDEFAEAVAAGVTDGTNPMQLIPRYQAAIMARRAVKRANN